MTDVIKYPLSVLDDLDTSGAAILDRAAAHDVIAPDELPAVLAATGEARNGPDNARAIAEAQERIEEEERTDVAARVREGVAYPFPFDHACEPEIADPDRGVWAGPAGARSLLASLEHVDHVDPDSVTMLQVSLGFACDEVDRLRARVEDLEQDARASETARLRAEMERLTSAVEEHLPVVPRLTADSLPAGIVERMAYAGEVLDERQRVVDAHEDTIRHLESEVERLTGEVEQHRLTVDMLKQAAAGLAEDVEAERNNNANAAKVIEGQRDVYDRLIDERAALTAALYRIAEALGANLPSVEDREADDARLRISLGVADLQEREGRLERSRDHWQAKAKRLERRVAVLTEERDGLTQRLGAKVAREVRKRRERTARIADDRRPRPRRRGRRRAEGGR